MRATNLFRGVYNTIGKEYLTNQAHFISLFFNAAGSSYFKVEPTKKYTSEAYQYKIFNGTKPLSKKIKDSFPSPINKKGLFDFLSKYINKTNVVIMANYFDLPYEEIDVRCICSALVEQFAMFIESVNDDVDNIIVKMYADEKRSFDNEMVSENAKTIMQQQKWKYNIVLLDDVEEQLEMLKEELSALFENELRYVVRIFACKNSIEVILESHNRDVDVYILDVARQPFHKWQTKEYDYFGYDLYKQIVTEKPNVLVKSKFYIFSRLPMTTIREEFEGAEVECLQKQTHSISEMAKIVKEHIDILYEKESKSLKEYTI